MPVPARSVARGPRPAPSLCVPAERVTLSRTQSKTDGMAAVEVVEARLADKPVLQRLVELYMHDFSEYTQRDVNEHGAFGYRYLDHYWTDPDRHPFLLRCDGNWCGFALIRSGDSNAVAEFFVLRKYRRRGL